MRKLLPILALLASCNSQADEEDVAAEAPIGEMAGNASGALPGAEDVVALQARVSRAMAVGLPGASTAAYRALRTGTGGAACGEVATQAKGLAGIFRPFVVTPDGLAVVADAPAIDWEDPDDFVADAYIRWCATPEELQRLAPQLQSAAAKTAAAMKAPAEEPDLPLPPVREDPVAEVQPPAAQPAPLPPPRKKGPPPPPPQIDSFFNSVDRPD
jgi:hypothetical protein